MVYATATAIFRELAVNFSVTSKLAFIEPADPSDLQNAYQVEIRTPLARGTARDVAAVKAKYGVSEIRTPVRHTDSGPRGKLVWV